jgi:hypothetical protein
MALVVDGPTATGNLTIGCCMYNPTNNCFYVATFGTSREFRRIDMNTNPPTYTVLCQTSDSQRFALSSDVPGGLTSDNDSGGSTPLNPSGMILNTSTIVLTVPKPGSPGQTQNVTYPPGTLAFLTDNGGTIYEGGSIIRRNWSKRLYRFDMRQVHAATSAQPDYDNAMNGAYPGNTKVGAFGIADWNDVFSVMVTEQNLLDALLPLTPNGSITFNLGRQGTLSTDGKSMYFCDSADDFGGIWKVNIETGAAQYFWNDRTDNIDGSSTRVNTEPCVVHTSVRDLDPANPAVGDQILFEGNSANIGGISYMIDTGAQALGPYIAWPSAKLEQWIEWNGSKWGVRKYTYNNADPIPADGGLNPPHDFACDSMCSDPDGTIYFHDGANYHGVWRYDLQNRFGLVRSRQVGVAFNMATAASSGNLGTLRMQTRTVQYTNPQTSATFPVRQINFMAVTPKGVGGIYAFKTGDFNRDNQVNETDVNLFKAAMAVPIATVESVTLGSSSFSCPVTLAAGLNTVEVQTFDRAGNASDIATVTFTCSVDANLPAVTINSPTNGQTISTRSFTVSGTASDPGTPTTGLSLVEVRVNGGAWVSTTGTTNWTCKVGLALGANTIEARSKDVAGNYSVISSVSVTCNAPADTTAPTVAISSPAAGITTTTWSTIASGTASDASSGVALVELRVNGGGWTTATTTSSYASWTCALSLWAGSNTIEARSKDYAGNYSTLASVTITCGGPNDITSPTVKISTPVAAQGLPAGTSTVTGTSSDSSTSPSGVGLVQVRANGGAWQDATTSDNWANWTCDIGLVAGATTIEARSKDRAGNYSLTNASVVVAVYAGDVVAPSLAISYPANGSVLGTWSTTVSGLAGDGGTNPSGVTLVEVRANGGAWQAATGTTSWTCPITLALGSNTIEARCKDFAGNYSATSATATVTCTDPPADATVPTVTISDPTINKTVTTFAYAVKGTANDADIQRSGVATVMVRLNGGDWIPAAVTPAVSTVSYYDAAVDNSGNPLETSTDQATWLDYLKYDMNGNGLVTAKDQLLLWRHLGYAPVDYNRDGYVDMNDFAHFQRCWTGTDVRQVDFSCGDAQLDGDDDVDAADMQVFMDCAKGPRVAADVTCMD